jgi:hypothetical protein
MGWGPQEVIENSIAKRRDVEKQMGVVNVHVFLMGIDLIFSIFVVINILNHEVFCF